MDNLFYLKFYYLTRKSLIRRIPVLVYPRQRPYRANPLCEAAVVIAPINHPAEFITA